MIASSTCCFEENKHKSTQSNKKVAVTSRRSVIHFSFCLRSTVSKNFKPSFILRVHSLSNNNIKK